MYDINLKNIKKGKQFHLMFLGIGIFILMIIIFVTIVTNVIPKSLDKNTISNKVDIRTHISDEGGTLYTSVYHYEVKGEEYLCSSNMSSNIYPSTENKLVYYDSSNPEHCMVEPQKSMNIILIIAMLLPIICIIIGISGMLKGSKRTKVIKELNKTGKLIKNLPYRLEDTGMTQNGVRIKRIVVDYVLPSGVSIELYGDPRHDNKLYDQDGMVDLIIDENNPEKYFIDFEINRISGNLESDYYIPKNQFNPYQQQIQNNNTTYDSENNIK